MTSAEALAFCGRWLPAWSGNRPEDLAAYYAEGAFYRDPALSEGLVGRAKLLRYFKRLLARYPDWTWEAVEALPTKRGFVLKWKAALPGGPPFFGVDIVELEGGLITRNEVYFDPAPLAAEAGKS